MLELGVVYFLPNGEWAWSMGASLNFSVCLSDQTASYHHGTVYDTPRQFQGGVAKRDKRDHGL
jgi:hypothetical protein